MKIKTLRYDVIRQQSGGKKKTTHILKMSGVENEEGVLRKTLVKMRTSFCS